MSAEEPREPTEEELRAALEAEMKQINADDVVVQTVVSLVNLGARRLGLVPGSEDEVDLAQAQTCIDAAKALLPIVEPRHGEPLKPVRDALSQLQMAFAQASRGPAAPPPADPAAEESDAGGPGPAQSSGKLWVPGQ
jgi:hypothetical protein